MHELGFHCKQFRKNGQRPYCWEDIVLVDWEQAKKEAEAALLDLDEFTDEQREVMK